MELQAWLEEVVQLLREHGILAIRSPQADGRIEAAQGFPKGFSELLKRYDISVFQAGEVAVFGNTTGQYYTIEHLWSDTHLIEPLLKARLVPFGRPDLDLVNYDPICFDMRNGNGIDAPIVRVDHEEILSHFRMPEPVAVADSFLDLLQRGPIQKELDA